MAQPTLTDLTAAAAAAPDPGFTPASIPRFGGVDPLGLRQINFDLMDEVFPGLNNVARHIRPFVVITWAWRRAGQLAQGRGPTHIKQGELEDFVDRIEVLYVASQALGDANADLPGRQYLAPLLKEPEFKFGGEVWQRRRKERRYSTALSAPVNYGPGLRTLGWVERHPDHPAIMVPTRAAEPALDAFEAQIGHILPHEAFSVFGPVVVTRDQAREWAGAWSLNSPTDAEAMVMSDLLMGLAAPVSRRLGAELMLSAAVESSSRNSDVLRAAMAGEPSTFTPPTHLLETRDAWRRVQVRQLFRLSLEALFYWTLVHLEGTSRSSESLVREFLDQAPPHPGVLTAGQWLASRHLPATGPTEQLTAIRQGLAVPPGSKLASALANGLAFCLADPPAAESSAARPDRLPLSRARREAGARADLPVAEFLRHVFEAWVLAQHAYWSVGRGLADARARGRILLRLKIVLDEGGWGLTPGVSRGGAPRPTPDRLETAIVLATECGLFKPKASAGA